MRFGRTTFHPLVITMSPLAVNHYYIRDLNYTETKRGVKDCVIYTSNVDPTKVYNSNVASMTKIFQGVIPINPYGPSNPSYENWSVIVAPAGATTYSGRYVVFDFGTNYGTDNYMAIRRVEFGIPTS